MKLNKITSDLSKAQALAIADWHMAHRDWATGNRHDRIAFKLYKLANTL